MTYPTHETLESRRLYSTVRLDDAGVLRITGTAGNDDISVSRYGRTEFQVSDGDAVSTFAMKSAKKLIFIGGPGDDRITLGNVRINAYLDGGAGDDQLSAAPRGEHADTLVGGDGNDYLFGGGGNDSLDGGNGYDTLFGGAGDDFLQIHSDAHGDDVVAGGDGFDTVSLAQYGTTPGAPTIIVIGGVDLPATSISDRVAGDVERVIGSPANDRITNASGHAVFMDGDAGRDTLVAGTADDVLIGGDGTDSGYWTGASEPVSSVEVRVTHA